MIWLICNNGDTIRATIEPLSDRFPHIEWSLAEEGPYEYDTVVNQQHPRLIKSHLPVRFFTKQLQTDVKIIVPVRNPKDTLVSFYHFYRMNSLFGNFAGSWDDFFEMCKAKKTLYGDFFDWYSGWWQTRDNPNVLFLTYEDMKLDLKKVTQMVSEFLEKPLTTELLEKIVNHLQFSNMKNNKSTNFMETSRLNAEISPFMRKGEVGDWKNYFSQYQSDYVDKRYRDTLLKHGLKLQFE